MPATTAPGPASACRQRPSGRKRHVVQPYALIHGVMPSNLCSGIFGSDGCMRRRHSQVGSYPLGASPYGVLDMAGNVWEWVNDWWNVKYYSISPYSNPPGPATGTYKVCPRGCWNAPISSACVWRTARLIHPD